MDTKQYESHWTIIMIYYDYDVFNIVQLYYIKYIETLVRHHWSWFQHVLECFNHQMWTNPPENKRGTTKKDLVLAFICFFLHTTVACLGTLLKHSPKKNGGDIYVFSICVQHCSYMFLICCTSPEIWLFNWWSPIDELPWWGRTSGPTLWQWLGSAPSNAWNGDIWTWTLYWMDW